MFKKMSTMFVVLAFIGITGSFAIAKDITTKNNQPTNFTTNEVNVPHIDKRNLKVWDNAWEIYQILIKFKEKSDIMYEDELLVPRHEEEYIEECGC